MRLNWKRIFVAGGGVFLICLLIQWYHDPREVFGTLFPQRWLDGGAGGDPSDVSILAILFLAIVLAAAWNGKSTK